LCRRIRRSIISRESFDLATIQKKRIRRFRAEMPAARCADGIILMQLLLAESLSVGCALELAYQVELFFSGSCNVGRKHVKLSRGKLLKIYVSGRDYSVLPIPLRIASIAKRGTIRTTTETSCSGSTVWRCGMSGGCVCRGCFTLVGKDCACRFTCVTRGFVPWTGGTLPLPLLIMSASTDGEGTGGSVRDGHLG